MLNKCKYLFCVTLIMASSTVASEEVKAKPAIENTVLQMIMFESSLAMKAEEDRVAVAMGLKAKEAPAATKVAPSAAALQQQPIIEDNNAKASTVKKESPEKDKSKIEVLGIFGLNENLFADLRIDTERVRFKSGLSAPIKGGAASGVSLVSIKVPCVTISRSDKRETVCIDKSSF